MFFYKKIEVFYSVKKIYINFASFLIAKNIVLLF